MQYQRLNFPDHVPLPIPDFLANLILNDIELEDIACLSGDTMVDVRDKGRVALKEVQVGDAILKDDSRVNKIRVCLCLWVLPSSPNG